MNYFTCQNHTPVFRNVMIETINRCNGVCSFCHANKRDEKRPFKKMTNDVFYKIVKELSELQWNGKLFLCVNNEPFIDNRIIDFAIYAKSRLSGVKIVLITNGTLLDIEKLKLLNGVADELIINDYSMQYQLSKNIRTVYRYVKSKSHIFSEMKIVINRRYSKEILATRAGNAPNKPRKNHFVNTPCIYPFTDLIIFPDGKVGMCCNDCKEISDFGDIHTETLLNIWNNSKFKNLRKQMLKGRNGIAACSQCDVVDAGEREHYINVFRKEIEKEFSL